MTARSVKILLVIVVVLVGILFTLNTANRQSVPDAGDRLLPGLEERLNDVDRVEVTSSADETVAIERREDRWVVSGKDDYPADTARLRTLLTGLADAKKVERKTADPARYERLSVQGPADGGGVLVEGRGADELSFAVILGTSAQQDYRYARKPDETQSWLIDVNPELPDSPAGWLERGIVDIPASRIAAVTIRHADGETVRLSKPERGAANFDIEGIPEGRELSYDTVGNPVAGALARLELEDVAAGSVSDDSVTTRTTYSTFDGLEVEVKAWRDGDETWVSLEARNVVPPAAGEGADTAGGSGSEAEASGGSAASEEAGEGADTAGGSGSEAQASAATASEEAEVINARVSGWRYRVPAYKADQMTRRWDDLLEQEDSGED